MSNKLWSEMRSAVWEALRRTGNVTSDLYSVDNWLRENKLLVQPADATPSESN